MRSQPLIAARDVLASSRWFQTDGFDAAISLARALGAEVLEEPHVNPNAKHREVWLRDPDGYVVVLAGARGDV